MHIGGLDADRSRYQVVGYGATMSRRIQFSLGWLVMFVLVIGAFLGGVSVGRRCHELENQWAKEELARERDRVMRDRLQSSADARDALPW